MHLHQKINANQLANIANDPKPISAYGPTIFMDHLTKYLTLVKPTRKASGKYSPLSMFKALKADDYIASDMGDISSEWILSAYKLLFQETRSKFIPSVSKTSALTLYSSAVPYIMYAFKSQFGVKYSEWDLQEPDFPGTDFNPGQVLLGNGHKDYFLKKEIYDNFFTKPSPPPDWVPESWYAKYGDEVAFEGDVDHEWMPNWTKPKVDLLEMRREYLIHSKTREHIPETVWGKGTWTVHPILFSIGSTMYRHMLTQTWVFSPRLRNEHMIMSFDNIDEMPEPIDPMTATKVNKIVSDRPSCDVEAPW